MVISRSGEMESNWPIITSENHSTLLPIGLFSVRSVGKRRADGGRRTWPSYVTERVLRSARTDPLCLIADALSWRYAVRAGAWG
ncbi:hypothetical protein ACRALDRAFT_2060990 [Sodiomyces alcalophilus JCM 7366]|uniref:uncharacterized protein n=1 Tax=Sodiomyces alcalophilus JCM 7366 TaxID=591952 RepID=UPI0039B6408B